LTQDVPAPPAQPGALTRRLVPAAVVVAGVAAGAAVAATHRPAASGASAAYGSESYGASARPSPSGVPAGAKPVATVSQIPANGGLVVANQDLVLTRDTAGTVRGFSAVCTHQGCTVSRVANGVISCPCHGSRFSATTGAVITGPAASPLPPVNVTVEGNDIYTS
jgi:Rieske Fe-S protein